jgi:hypothetical protein
LDSLDGLRLMLALRTLTRVEGLEAAIDAAGVAKGSTPHALLLALAREQKTFSAQWAALEFWKAAKS